ncbi:HNH endonuclease [Citrobacter sedlakii]
MAKVNKFGLSRNIPASVKREVRKRCGFGCVICACPIIEYEHIDPPFHLAKEHLVESIALLCPNCHAKVTKRLYPKDKVKKALLNPAAFNKGVTSLIHEFDSGFPVIKFGGSTFYECNIPLVVRNENILEINMQDQVALISGRFYDSKGRLSLEIIENEWVCGVNNWDVEIIGPRLIIKEKKHGSVLSIVFDVPNAIDIKSFNMLVNGLRVVSDDKSLRFNGNSIRVGYVAKSPIGFNIS